MTRDEECIAFIKNHAKFKERFDDNVYFLEPKEVIKKGDYCLLMRVFEGSGFIDHCWNSVGHILEIYRMDRNQPEFYVFRELKQTNKGNILN